MKSGLPILLAIMSLLSCEKPAPPSVEVPAASSNPSLAASQLALAQTHLTAESYDKAIPYLEAAIANGSSANAETLLREALSSEKFSVPATRFTHPYPVTTFISTDTSLFAAIGGPHPTVVRWVLGESNTAAAVLFPAGTETISHLTLSPSGKHLLVGRGDTNLLCLAETLKPVSNLGTFPDYLQPTFLQTFSENSLLLAHPTANNHTLFWHIRDAATGETLRSDSFPLYPKPILANFQGTTLLIDLEDRTTIEIPLVGDTIRNTLFSAPAFLKPSPQTFTRDENSIIRHINIPSTHSSVTPSVYPAVTGYKLDPASQALSEIPIPNRLEILSEHFPEIIPPTLKIFSADTAVTRRFADAFPDQFPELTAQARSHADLIRQVFATGERDAILAVIDSASHGLPFATALYFAIESQDPALLSRAIEKATGLPPALRALAKRESSPDTDLDHLRATEDWHGYESPDFAPLLQRFRGERADTLAALTLPEQPSEADISAFSLRLTSPATLATLGKPLLAEKAIAAARSLSENPGHAETAIRLSVFAQNLGAHPAACLRVRAAAHTALGDSASAHAAWINLITNQPEAAHLPTDYTEAAHTAFETGDARQAIEILNTGLFRFPNAPSAAIRSAWIALLTGHDADALRYLNHAAKLGLPPDEIENTTALFAIAHAKLGDFDMAASHHAQLTAISPKWNDPENLATLTWPDSFKQSLLGIISGAPENEPWPSPENDPTDTVPLPGEFPIEEPPLPSR